jgi:SAM-dependent methyltransferase
MEIAWRSDHRRPFLPSGRTLYLSVYVEGDMSVRMSSAATSAYVASDGSAYELFLGRWTKRLADPLLAFANFPSTGDLLDVGCGTGSLALTMADHWPGRRVVGIDVAEPYIAFARGRKAAEIPAFEVGDAAKLPYDDDSFAGCATQLVLNFVPRPLEAVAEMRRVTVPGGVVVAAVWDFRGGLVYQRIFWDTAAGIDPNAGLARDRLFSAPLALPSGLLNLFKDAGLAQVQQTSITIRMAYADFNDYWQPLLGGQGPVGTYVINLAPELRLALEAAVKKAFCSGAPDGERSMTATAWAVRGIVPQTPTITSSVT